MDQIQWPGGNKSAAMFSFDLDGDVIWRNMSADEPNSERLIRARSIGQYGPNRCVDMILDLLEQYGVHATFFVPGFVAECNPEVIRRIASAGHEVGNHGYMHERFVEMPEELQRERLRRTQEVLRDLTGKEPVGFRTPSGDWHVKFIRHRPRTVTPILLSWMGWVPL